jgi:hypothetical protein
VSFHISSVCPTWLLMSVCCRRSLLCLLPSELCVSSVVNFLHLSSLSVFSVHLSTLLLSCPTPFVLFSLCPYVLFLISALPFLPSDACLDILCSFLSACYLFVFFSSFAPHFLYTSFSVPNPPLYRRHTTFFSKWKL